MHKKTMAINVLLVDADRTCLERWKQQLSEAGFRVETAAEAGEALAMAAKLKGDFHVAVIDAAIAPAGGAGLMLELHRLYPVIEVIILDGQGGTGSAEKAVDLGAFDCVRRPAEALELIPLLKNATRIGRERQRSEALEALVMAGNTVGKAASEHDLYERVHREALRLLPSLDGFLISEFDTNNNEVRFPFCCKGGEEFAISTRQGGNSITEYVIRTGQPLLLANGDRDFRARERLDPPDPKLGYVASEAVAPMFLESGIYGAITAFTFDADVHYTPEHLQVLQAYANQVVVSIRNFQQLKEARQVRDATASLASKRGKDEVLRAIVRGAHELIGSDLTGIILQDEDGFLHKVRPSIPEDLYDRFGEPRQQDGITRQAASSRQPLIIRDTSTDPRVKQAVRAAGIRSMLALPLVHGERVLGVLYTHMLSFRKYGVHDVDLWESFATQAAAALDRALAEEQQRRDYETLIAELDNFNDQADLPEVMKRVATGAKRIFGSDTCRLAYVDPPTGRILSWAWAEDDPQGYRCELEARPDGVTYYVIRTRQPVFRTIGDGEVPGATEDLVRIGLKSFASLPLLYGGRTIGVLHCNYVTRQQPFDDHYRTLMEAFDARAAVALHRAHRVHRGERWQGLYKDILGCSEPSQLYRLFAGLAHKVFSADLTIFYPHDPASLEEDGDRYPILSEYVREGELRQPWQPPVGGRGGGVLSALEEQNGMLIVNNLEEQGGRYMSDLARREGIQSFIAARLEVLAPDSLQPRMAGVLFLNRRTTASFTPGDVMELRYACDHVAAGILRLKLQSELRAASEQRSRQLRAVLNVFQELEDKSSGLDLDLVAEEAGKALGIDACSIIEYDRKKKEFTERGNYGLLYPELLDGNPRSRFRDKYMMKQQVTVIPDVQQDSLMRTSRFVQRERIKSTVVAPMWANAEQVGLFFVNYRRKTDIPAEDVAAIGLFADLAAQVLHAARLGIELSEEQLKSERRLFLIWVSMMEDSWRHSLVHKAFAIWTQAVHMTKALDQVPRLPKPLTPLRTAIPDIARLARDIANAPPRIPTSWEMKAEYVPLGPLLSEVAEREGRKAALLQQAPARIEVSVEQLGGIQVRGYRRWLIYMLESVIHNSLNAMPEGGTVMINGITNGPWVEIRIRDEGAGVPESLRGRLFKTMLPRRRDRSGLGIGSLLAATIVEEHNGTIELEKPGPGDTTVLIRLRIAKKAEGR